MKLTGLIFIIVAFSVPMSSQVDSAMTMRYVVDNHSFLWKNKVPLGGYSYKDPMINASVMKTIRYYKKSENKFVLGVILSSVGILITGAALLSDPTSGGDWNTSGSFGPAPSAVSGVFVGASLPFFISSASNKRKMKESLTETKRLLVQ